MCRILSYLGKSIVIEELLYESDNSFIKQSYHPKYMSHLLNLAGFGMAAWDTTSHNASWPFLYKTAQLPFYDENLRNLSSKISPYCLLAHLRGVTYSEKQVVSNQNVHPFIFPGTTVALAHNGSLYDFDLMKYDLLSHIKPEYHKNIRGTTDSEWIYAIFLSQLPPEQNTFQKDEIIHAILETLKILQRVRHKHAISISSPVNLFIANGDFIAATRFVFDYGWTDPDISVTTHSTYHSLWYTLGESYSSHDNQFRMKSGKTNSSIIVASEPLTENTATWVEVPEYTLIVASRVGSDMHLTSQDINI